MRVLVAPALLRWSSNPARSSNEPRVKGLYMSVPLDSSVENVQTLKGLIGDVMGACRTHDRGDTDQELRSDRRRERRLPVDEAPLRIG